MLDFQQNLYTVWHSWCEEYLDCRSQAEVCNSVCQRPYLPWKVTLLLLKFPHSKNLSVSPQLYITGVSLSKFCMRLTKAYTAEMSCISCYWFCYTFTHDQFTRHKCSLLQVAMYGVLYVHVYIFGPLGCRGPNLFASFQITCTCPCFISKETTTPSQSLQDRDEQLWVRRACDKACHASETTNQMELWPRQQWQRYRARCAA